MTTPCPSCGYTGKPWPGKGTDGLGKLIVKLVARVAFMDVEEMLGENRGFRHLIVRATACKIMRNHADLSWPQIGRVMGGRDHSTMMNSRKWWLRPDALHIEGEVLEIMRRNMEKPIA